MSAKKIVIASSKGGVGKSSVTAMSALWTARHGHSVAIMDADITGPSIPRMFGVGPYDLTANDTTIFPAQSVTGIKVMSMNLLMEQEDQPVIPIFWQYEDYVVSDKLVEGFGRLPFQAMNFIYTKLAK